MRLRYWLVSGGMMMRSACGRTTRRRVWPSLSPIARAASSWPLLTASMPPRMISAMKAAVIERQPKRQGRELGREVQAATEVERAQLRHSRR